MMIDLEYITWWYKKHTKDVDKIVEHNRQGNSDLYITDTHKKY